MRLGKPSTTFGRLTKCVWKNCHLSTRTKVWVYKACVLSILLYGAESWATYRSQESKLNAFNSFNLRFILGKTWENKIANEEVFKMTGYQSFSMLKLFCLCWRDMWTECLNTEFHDSYCMVCWRRTHDPLEGCGSASNIWDLKNFNIKPVVWTFLSKDCASLKLRLHAGRLYDTASNLGKLLQRRQKRTKMLNKDATHCHPCQHTTCCSYFYKQLLTSNV